MSTEAQITANRRNAAKSTGPKTAEGKAIASRNALSHGLRAKHLVLFDERSKDFARLRDNLRASLDPADALEAELVERIVLCAWRLRRAGRAEAAVINRSATEFQEFKIEPELGRVFNHASPHVALISRYEATLDRALRRAHALLERRQARRRGESVLPPIAIEVDGLEELADGRASPGENENCRTKPISGTGDRAGDNSDDPL
jgi:hypothetical protein